LHLLENKIIPDLNKGLITLADKSNDNNRAESNRQLKIRQTLRNRRPKFRRIESWRYKRIKDSWRKARGLDNKARLKRLGWPISPQIGYRSPASIRYQSSSGKEEIMVFNKTDLLLINPDTQVGRLAANLGRKKKENIISEAELLNVHLINPISEKVDLGELEEELELDEEKLEDIELEDLKLSKEKEEHSGDKTE